MNLLVFKEKNNSYQEKIKGLNSTLKNLKKESDKMDRIPVQSGTKIVVSLFQAREKCKRFFFRFFII